MRKLVMSGIACAVLSGGVFADEQKGSAPVAADANPDGTVSLTGGSVAAGVGYVWGHGKLSYGDAETLWGPLPPAVIATYGAVSILTSGLPA